MHCSFISQPAMQLYVLCVHTGTSCTHLLSTGQRLTSIISVCSLCSLTQLDCTSGRPLREMQSLLQALKTR